MSHKTLRATTILTGTTIGAGVYAVPYAFTKIGFLTGIAYLLILGGVMLFVNLLYGEVVLRTKDHHQLTGYGEIYLGSWGKLLAAISLFVGFYGAILAYLVKIGEFLALVTNYNNPALFSIIFFVLGSLVVYKGLKTVSLIDIFLLFFLIVVIGIVTLSSLGMIKPANFELIHLQLDNFFLPYGIILFALFGSSAVPEVSKALIEEPKKLRKAVTLGSIIPIIVCLVFATIVVGVSGAQTSNDAISGLKNFLPFWVIGLGALMGIITMSTAFFSLGYALKEMWQYDFDFPRPIALLLALVPSLLLFLIGDRNFIQILEIAGAITGGLTGILIILMFMKAKKINIKPAYSLNPSKIILIVLTLIFTLGMLFPFFGN